MARPSRTPFFLRLDCKGRYRWKGYAVPPFSGIAIKLLGGVSRPLSLHRAVYVICQPFSVCRLQCHDLHIGLWRSEQRAWTRVTVPLAFEITQLKYYSGQFVALDRHFQILTLGMEKWSFAVGVQVDEELFLDGCPPLPRRMLGPVPHRMFGLASVGLRQTDGVSNGQDKFGGEKRNWRGVKSFGKSSLFLSKNLYFSLAFDSSEESASVPEVLRPNCIYFERVNAGCFYMGIYHMDRENVE